MHDQKLFNRFLTLCDNGFAAVDSDGCILEVNKALCELTGRTESSLTGAGLEILFDSFSVETILRIYNAFDCHEISHTISGDLLQKKGSPRLVEIFVNCTADERWLLIKNRSFRKEMENKLRRSELMLSTTLESLPFDFWINDDQNRTWMQNSYSKALWGDVKGKSPEEVGAEEKITGQWQDTTERALRGEVVEGEIEYIIDGHKKTFRNILAPIKDDEKILGILGMNIDITDLKEALNIRDMLVKEVHHRVKNNLHMINSIIQLESARIPDGESSAVLDDLVSRIEAVSLVHEKLYTTGNNNLVHTADYIRDLVDHIISGVRAGNVMVDYNLDDIDLETDRIIILGLIINELVTNAVKYAFTGEGRHVLKLSMKKKNNEIIIVVTDDGPGLKTGTEKEPRGSLGFKLMDVLSEQLGGKLERQSSPAGCSNSLVFPVKKAEA